MPDWFKNGMEAALLAPTAMNQQKFLFSLDGNQVSAKAGIGFYSHIDLGIVKYHLNLGLGQNILNGYRLYGCKEEILVAFFLRIKRI